MWSVLSDQQLIGRVWRHPQPKKVHVYRLIGDRSPDVLLNNISFDKGFIQAAFANLEDGFMSKFGSFLTRYVDSFLITKTILRALFGL